MSDLKHEIVYDLLKEKISEMEPGGKLPSLRDLMKEYGVSQLTIDKAKEILVNEGLIYNVTGKGAFVLPQQPLAKQSSDLKHMILAIPDWETSFLTTVVNELRNALSEGQQLDVIKFSSNANALNMIKKANPDAFLMVPFSKEMTLADMILLNTISCPYVFLDRSFNDIAVDSVDFDSDACGEAAAKHLVELGHKKLAVLITEPNISTIKERVMGFSRYVRALNLELNIIDCKTKSGEDPKEKAHKFLGEAIQKGNFDSTGVFVVSDCSALGAFKALYDNDIKVPEQVSIVGCNGAPEGAYYLPALTTASYDYELMAKTALKILTRRINENPDSSLKESIPPQMIIRDSTRKI